MTRFVEEALCGGVDSDAFGRLLYNYGLWSRGGWCKGWFSGLIHHETCIIDDDTALIVDKAVQMVLKSRRENLYRLFYMYYVSGYNEYEICSRLHPQKATKLRRERRKGYFEYNHATDGALRYLNASTVRDLIVYSEKLVFEEMRRQFENTARLAG